jgi:hypothetical protein
MAEDYEGYLGAARMSQALFAALMMRQMQNSYASSWQKALAGMPTGGGVPGGASGGAPGGFSGGDGSPGLPAQLAVITDDGSKVITDDGSNWTAPQGQAQPGLISRVGNAIAHPIQTAEDAWNYPGFYLGDAANGMGAATRSAVTLPGDVATGKVDMNDPSQAGSNASRVLGAALLTSPAYLAGLGARTGTGQ